MPRQIENLAGQRKEFRNACILQRKARLAKTAFQGVAWIFPFKVRHQIGQALELRLWKTESFAHVANSRPAAIRDHVRRHRRAKLTVAFIDILNGLLAPVAAWQIDLDVRPFIEFFRKYTVE